MVFKGEVELLTVNSAKMYLKRIKQCEVLTKIDEFCKVMTGTEACDIYASTLFAYAHYSYSPSLIVLQNMQTLRIVLK